MIYFMGKSGVQVFKLIGDLQEINSSFAHDDKSIYWFDGYEPALRFSTRDVSLIQLIDENFYYSDLSTAEGVYSFDNGAFKKGRLRQGAK